MPRNATKKRKRLQERESSNTVKPNSAQTETQTFNPSNLLHLQQTIGNQAVLQMHSAVIQRQPATPTTYEWLGQIHGTWNAALREEPKKDKNNPHDGTLADLPRNTYVRVIGKQGGWLKVQVDIDEQTLEGYVSQELVKHVQEGEFDFSDEGETISVMTLNNAFLTLKRAETQKAKDADFVPQGQQADDIQEAIEMLEENNKYAVDRQTYQVTFVRDGDNKLEINTIEDFVLFVETVERQYPSADPKAIAGEIRQLWYSDENWDVLVGGSGIMDGKKKVDIETEPNPIAKQFDMKNNIAPKEGGKQITTSMGTVDIGHVMAGIDGALNGSPDQLPSGGNELKYKTMKELNEGDPRDFVTWSGDLGQAYAEYLVKRWVKPDASATLESSVDEKATDEELLGDIHGYIALEVWKKVPESVSPSGGELKVSNVLRDMYMVGKDNTNAENKSYQDFLEIVSGKEGDELKEFIVERSIAFAKPWYAKKAYDERGWWSSDGWFSEGILEGGMEDFEKSHEKNESDAADEDKLGGLVDKFVEMLSDKLK